jgi:hypothetical protein
MSVTSAVLPIVAVALTKLKELAFNSINFKRVFPLILRVRSKLSLDSTPSLKKIYFPFLVLLSLRLSKFISLSFSMPVKCLLSNLVVN